MTIYFLYTSGFSGAMFISFRQSLKGYCLASTFLGVMDHFAWKCVWEFQPIYFMDGKIDSQSGVLSLSAFWPIKHSVLCATEEWQAMSDLLRGGMMFIYKLRDFLRAILWLYVFFTFHTGFKTKFPFKMQLHKLYRYNLWIVKLAKATDHFPFFYPILIYNQTD